MKPKKRTVVRPPLNEISPPPRPDWPARPTLPFTTNPKKKSVAPDARGGLERPSRTCDLPIEESGQAPLANPYQSVKSARPLFAPRITVASRATNDQRTRHFHDRPCTRSQRGAVAATIFILQGKEVVPEGGFEPPTRGFSIRCSTN